MEREGGQFKFCCIVACDSIILREKPPSGADVCLVSVTSGTRMCTKMPCSEDDDSQSSFNIEPMQGMSKAELRKTNKPIMEKKRRARINHCLNELKDLLMDSMDKDPARHSKLEKADILEMTVKHLQTLQRQQLAAAIAADPEVLHRFKSGFGDCAVEVRRYLSRLVSVPTGLRHRLGNHLNSCLSGIQHLHPKEYPPLVPDPLRLDDERPSAFHFVRSTKPTSPPLSPLSCDSACDSSTELETPPRPVQTFPFPTPPSRSASDQDTSPETQKPTVSSTTISPESIRQEALRNKKYMEPLSIVIDVENYKIGIDASPKRAVDYSIRHKLKRSVADISGPASKVIRTEPEKSIAENVESKFFDHRSSERVSAFDPIVKGKQTPSESHKFSKLTLPKIITTPYEKLAQNRLVAMPDRTVISHTAESLAQSSTSKKDHKVKDKAEADTSSRSPERPSGSSEMWRPW